MCTEEQHAWKVTVSFRRLSFTSRTFRANGAQAAGGIPGAHGMCRLMQRAASMSRVDKFLISAEKTVPLHCVVLNGRLCQNGYRQVCVSSWMRLCLGGPQPAAVKERDRRFGSSKDWTTDWDCWLACILGKQPVHKFCLEYSSCRYLIC